SGKRCRSVAEKRGELAVTTAKISNISLDFPGGSCYFLHLYMGGNLENEANPQAHVIFII
ncbi:MAG TPA: hypothetical protein VN604_08620, partial [Nitrospirota bacterium]|nr:hypothetical protein [Nitrospirota bacterium]